MSRQSDWSDEAMWAAYNDFHYRCDTHRFQKLFTRAELVRRIADVPGDIIDAGAFKGTSTLQFAHALETYQPNSRTRVLSFDTFEAVFPQARADEKASADRPGLRVSLLHCDLDVYAPTLTVLQNMWPRVVRGGIVVFDEYAVDNWGESDAVDEFLSTIPGAPKLKILPGSPTPTAYCIKE